MWIIFWTFQQFIALFCLLASYQSLCAAENRCRCIRGLPVYRCEYTPSAWPLHRQSTRLPFIFLCPCRPWKCKLGASHKYFLGFRCSQKSSKFYDPSVPLAQAQNPLYRWSSASRPDGPLLCTSPSTFPCALRKWDAQWDRQSDENIIMAISSSSVALVLPSCSCSRRSFCIIIPIKLRLSQSTN